MDLGLKDKVVVVTGASKGIGLATARLLLQEGAKVAICSVTEAICVRRSRNSAVWAPFTPK